MTLRPNKENHRRHERSEVTTQAGGEGKKKEAGRGFSISTLPNWNDSYRPVGVTVFIYVFVTQ